MWVEVPPSRRKMTLYLPPPSKLGILQSEAGDRTQSELKQIRHTGVNGETAWIKQVLEKCLKGKPQSE